MNRMAWGSWRSSGQCALAGVGDRAVPCALVPKMIWGGGSEDVDAEVMLMHMEDTSKDRYDDGAADE